MHMLCGNRIKDDKRGVRIAYYIRKPPRSTQGSSVAARPTPAAPQHDNLASVVEASTTPGF